MNKTIKYADLLRQRNLWLGLAMLWIMLGHSGFSFGGSLFLRLKQWGYGGVDICLFASGAGCCLSLEKDGDLLRFQKRRLLRLAPVYLCFIIPWILWRMWLGDFPATAVLGNLLGIQHLTDLGNSFNWYISGLIVMYLLAPYLKQLADRSNGWQQLWVIVGLLLLSVPFWGGYTYIIIVSRIPVFYLGILLGKACREEKTLTGRQLLGWILVAVLGIFLLEALSRRYPETMWIHGLYWYPFLLITPGLCFGVSAAADFLERWRICRLLCCGLGFVGKYSFEVYLAHLTLFEELHNWLPTLSISLSWNQLWLCSLPVVAVLAWLLHAGGKLLSGVFRKNAQV